LFITLNILENANPGAVMVHLEDTLPTHRAMVASVRLDMTTLLTVSDVCNGGLSNNNYSYILT